MNEILMAVAMGALGLAAHFLKKFVEMQRSGKDIVLRNWWLGNWAATSLSLLLTGGGIALLFELGDLSMASAFLMGMSGGSGADVLGERRGGAVVLKQP